MNKILIEVCSKKGQMKKNKTHLNKINYYKYVKTNHINTNLFSLSVYYVLLITILYKSTLITR